MGEPKDKDGGKKEEPAAAGKAEKPQPVVQAVPGQERGCADGSLAPRTSPGPFEPPDLE